MTIIYNAILVPDGSAVPSRGWLAFNRGTILSLGHGDAPAALFDSADERIDAAGAYLLPGAIDCHVHFREPGLTHKATIASESRAALAGGVTSYIEMPNTKPATVTLADWEAKMHIAEAGSAGNYAFMLGATADNLTELQHADFSKVAAVKVFMGSSTGNMLLADDSALRAVFAERPGRIVVHAEDQSVIDRNIERFSPIPDPDNMLWHTRLRSNEACVRATERAMELASRYGSRLHVAHLTTLSGKMSKSKGEFLTVSLLEEKGYAPVVYRFFCLQSHYRKSLVFSWENLDNAAVAYGKLIAKIAALPAEDGAVDMAAAAPLQQKFRTAMDNDLNTSMAVTVLYDVLKAKTNGATKRYVLADFDRVLSLDLLENAARKKAEQKQTAPASGGFQIVSESGETDAQVEALLQARYDAKKAKDFTEADRIRDDLKAMGVEITDIPGGVRWKR